MGRMTRADRQESVDNVSRTNERKKPDEQRCKPWPPLGFWKVVTSRRHSGDGRVVVQILLGRTYVRQPPRRLFFATYLLEGAGLGLKRRRSLKQTSTVIKTV